VALSVALSLVALTAGCVRGGRTGDIGVNRAGASIEQQFDTRRVDVSGDADRARLSGHNNLNNPPVDLKAVPPAWSGGTAINQGRWSGNALGDRVAQLTLSVPHVASSVAVPSGRVVLVGVGLSRSGNPNVGAIKTEIRRRLLVQAPIFRYVYVTTDPRQVTQLNQIADGLRQGNPISRYHPQMEALMRTMQPVPWPG
jgi:hypothetical protein